MIMSSVDITAVLPHRFPILLVDRIIELVPGERIVGLKNVTVNEPFFQGHFPDYPVMPGVLILEALAQTGAVMMLRDADNAGLPFLAGIDKARFRRQVVPGDQLRLELSALRQRGPTCKLAGKAYVGDELAAEAEILAVSGEPS
ncbi:MAG: 3-hydroxyacyl-ACP dehydratase FabZ [Candidatus Latescibacteria bacterium]|nr:3-hydroxyacyl-ACP dehydratase FabZ [Candidatus Latescibacterota bacterium]